MELLAQAGAVDVWRLANEEDEFRVMVMEHVIARRRVVETERQQQFLDALLEGVARIMGAK